VSFLASPSGKGRTHTSFTRWCDPPGSSVVFYRFPIFFPDGHPCFADSALHGDLVREPRVHVHRFRLRHDPALGQRTGRSSHCAHPIKSSQTASPPRLPAKEEAWTAPPSPLSLGTIASSCQAGGDTGADSPTRRNRGYDGPTSRGSHDHNGRQRASRILACHDAASARAVRPEKSAAFRSGQRRSVTRQDDMSKRPNVRREANGPPTRRWSTATDVRASRFLSGMRPPPLRT